MSVPQGVHLHLGIILSVPSFIQKYLSNSYVPGPVLGARDRFCLGRTGLLVKETPDDQGNQVMNPEGWESLLFHSPHLAVLLFNVLEIRSFPFFFLECPLLGLQMSMPLLSPRLECLLLPPPDSSWSFCPDLNCPLLLFCIIITEHHTLQCPDFVDMSVTPPGLWTL